MSGTGTSVSFQYDHNGLRTQKAVTENGVTTTTNYIYNGKLLAHMTRGSDNMHFYYDAQGRPAMVDYNGTKYAYLHNLQGDVIGIAESTGELVVEYKYDAWGLILDRTGSLVTTLGYLNPFRYRGYVYDEETGLYYCRSRYYRSGWGRFLSADALIKGNLYCYCKDDPIEQIDPDGKTELGYAAWQYWQENAKYFAAADGPYPFLDAIAVGGLVVVGGAYVIDGAVALYNLAVSKPIVETIEEAQTDEVPQTITYIYRHGSKTYQNLTPRLTDTDLSFSLIPPPDGRYFRTTMEAVNATGILIAINDHDNHVAIYPVIYPTIEQWRKSRPNANTNPHPYTLLLRTLEQ